MKRRQLIRYAATGLLSATATLGASEFQSYRAQSRGSVSVQWLGHTCFLFTGNGMRILVNPFQNLGCTAKYRLPKVKADLVLISSQLLDEGAVGILSGSPRVLFEPGVYDIKGMRIQGISVAHDREGGRRFGTNVAWQWHQGGVKILHLGGAAGPIEIEQKILMGSPDLAIVPVGGGQKAYTPQEAKQAIEVLDPKLVIPTHYLTKAADKNTCDLMPVDEFLKLADNMPVSRINSNTMVIGAGNLPKQGTAIRVLSY